MSIGTNIVFEFQASKGLEPGFSFPGLVTAARTGLAGLNRSARLVFKIKAGHA